MSSDYAAPTEPSKGVVLRRTLMVLVPLLVIAFGFGSCQALNATRKKPEKAEGPPAAIAVEIADAKAETLSTTVTTQGEVKPRTTTELAARVSGQVSWVNPRLEPGAFFSTGEKLIQVDEQSYQLALRSLEAEAARARESLERARAEAQLAERNIEELGLGTNASDLARGRPQVATAQATLQAAEARIAEARLSLERTAITAPYAGRIIERRIDTGDFVSMGMPVATIFATDVAQIRVPLTNDDLKALNLAPGFSAGGRRGALAATLTADVGGTPHTWQGRLVSVEAMIDARSRQAFALVEVSNPFDPRKGAALVPGMFPTVAVNGSGAQDLVSIPRGALKRGGEIYVVKSDMTLDIRNVTPTQTTSDAAYLSEGLKAGERVVVSYVPTPRAGMSVRDLKAVAEEKPKTETKEASAEDKGKKDAEKKKTN